MSSERQMNRVTHGVLETAYELGPIALPTAAALAGFAATKFTIIHSEFPQLGTADNAANELDAIEQAEHIIKVNGGKILTDSSSKKSELKAHVEQVESKLPPGFTIDKAKDTATEVGFLAGAGLFAIVLGATALLERRHHFADKRAREQADREAEAAQYRDLLR